MICKVCGSEFDREMFDVCPFCLTPADEEKRLEEPEHENLETESVEEPLIEMSNTEPEEATAEEETLLNQEENEEPLTEPKKVSNEIPHIVLQQIDDLSVRAKNVFAKNKITTFRELLLFLKNNKVSDLRGAGVGVEVEVSNIISRVLCGDFSSGETSSEFQKPEDAVISAINSGEQPNVHIDRITGMSVRTYNICRKNNAHDMLGIAHLIKENKKLRGAGASFEKEIPIIFDRFLSGAYSAEMVEETNVLALENVLAKATDKREFDVYLRRAKGETLQEIGDNPTNPDDEVVSRERIRQIEAKFYKKNRQLLMDMVKEVFEDRPFFGAQELRDIYNNEDFGTVLVAMLKNGYDYLYLDYADLFVRRDKYGDVDKKIHSIVSDFVGDGIDLYANADEIDDLFRNNGIDFMGLGELISYMQESGYRFSGDYVTYGRVSYAVLCLEIIKERFPQGIKLNQDNDNPCEDLRILRNLAKERFGDIGIPDQDRALTARLADHLVICDRGRAIVPENIQIDLSLVNEIKDYIDNYNIDKIYYSEIYANFEGVLQMTSNVNNYYFLHGVLMMYFPDEYEYQRDYLVKKDAGNQLQSVEDRIRQFICEKGRPVSRKELRDKFPGFTDIMISLQFDESLYLVQREYSFYTSMDLYSYDSSDIFRLSGIISKSLDGHFGFSSENLLYDDVCAEMADFVKQNKMTSPVHLFYFCQKVLKDKYMFRHPNIGRYGLVDILSMKDIAIYFIGGNEAISYSDFLKTGNSLKWSEGSTYNAFLKIADDYYRTDSDNYLLKDKFHVDSEVANQVESYLLGELNKNDFVSLMDFEDFSDFLEMEYEWNTYILESIVRKYIPTLEIVSQEYKDKRYHKSYIVKKEEKISSYAELVARVFKKNGYTTLSAGKLLSFLVVNGLAYANIPKELETSGFFKKEKEFYSLV